ncbi:high mobility group B protein 9-like [Salvia divinorum]|uniref:High mobility group B protein 9-like n=1 Tax=Salvia divinorum TaxID=28513 RepID=A0ABD1FNG3_SALDI
MLGTIDAKFDCGYLVSVKLGDETLNGVLYHPGNPGAAAPAPPTCNALGKGVHEDDRRVMEKLSPEDRVVYKNYELKDKERYQKEFKEYKERLKMVQTLPSL